MSASDAATFAAEILQRSCQSFGGYAAAGLLESRPDAARRYGPDAFARWKSDVAQRVLELAVALRMGEPRVFVARVQWASKAFQARNLDIGDLRASLAALRDVLTEQLPEQGRSMSLDYLDQGLAALSADTRPTPDKELDPTRPNDRIALSYLQKALSGDIAGATAEVCDAVSRDLPVTKAYLEVLLPAQREIGRLWFTAQVSVAEEHLVTSAIQRTMAVLAHNAPAAASNGKTAVVAAITRNAHDVGLRAAADLYQLAGWRALFLGADVPHEDLPAILGVFDADVLLLGVAMAPQLPVAGQAIKLIREKCERPVRVIVGGAAVDEAPEIWEMLGADGYATDLASVERLGARLVGLPD